MKKAYVVLTIAGCMLAMTAAVAQHVPVTGTGDCPISCDPYAAPPDGTVCFVIENPLDPCTTTPGLHCPLAWPTAPLVPMPTFPLMLDDDNAMIIFPDPIIVDLPASFDFCGWADQVYCSLGPIALVVPEVGQFANLVMCGNMDLNGPLNTCLDVPVQSNGIPDQYELGLLSAVLNTPANTHHAAAVAAMQNNMDELINLIIDALNAEVGPAVVGSLMMASPWTMPGLAGLLSGFAVLGDTSTNAALDEVLGLLEQIGLTPPPGGIAALCDSVPAIGPDGKLAGGAFTNREIYEWNIQVNPAMTVAEYVALCLNPATTVPAKVTISGGGTKLTGSNVTLAANVSNVAVGLNPLSTYVWYKWGLTGGTVCKNPPTCDETCPEEGWVVLSGETGSALTITAAQLSDSGKYAVEVSMDDGTKAVVGDIMAKTTLIVSDTAVPIGGALGLTLLAGACALAGAVGIRRRK